MTAASDSSSGDSRTPDSCRYVLGVDGGGTKTEAWIANVDVGGEPAVIGRGKAGPSNPRAVGFDAAMSNLAAAVDAAWADASCAASPVDVAALAISGAGHIDMQRRVIAWSGERGLARRTLVVHDADPVLAAGTPTGWGVALIVGTGSAAIAVDQSGGREVVGGWGFWFGDEGSAYWIGRRALEAVARAADGRGPATTLADGVAGRLKTSDPRAILGVLEQSGNVRGAIAALAAVAGKAAESGDAVALGIVDDAAGELAGMVASSAAKLRLGDRFPLALTGGVACGSELVRERLLAALAARSLQPAPVELVAHPAAGCVQIAWHALEA